MKALDAYSAAASRGAHTNSGNGATFTPVDIGHDTYLGLVDPATAFWSLVRKDRLTAVLAGGPLREAYLEKRDGFRREMHKLRFGLAASAVYFNPTSRCDLDCRYCYIPRETRRSGAHMPRERLFAALEALQAYFERTLDGGAAPQIIFHGAEPLLNKEAVLAAIDRFGGYFRFGVQTNGAAMDQDTLSFITSRGVGLGLSLDGATAATAARTRRTWGGAGVFEKVDALLESLRGYHNYNVICTVTSENMAELAAIVEYFHAKQVPVCMLNPVRLTMPGAREIKPADHELAPHYLAALDRSRQLYRDTGRKLVVANFANVLVSILAPMARRLMCDITPCGGGRAFFAVASNGDLFPCSEFVGVPDYKGGNLFTDGVEAAMASAPFAAMRERLAERIEPCRACALRHFCGAPCPAEAAQLNGGLNTPGGFCELYEEQIRYALRAVAEGVENDFLWDNWDADTVTTFQAGAM